MSCCCCFFFFLLLDSNWNIGSSLGLQPAGIWTGTYTVIYPESPVGPLQTLDHVGQLLITDLTLSLSLYISMYTYNNIHSAHAQSLSCVQLFVTPCTVAHQASLPMGFSRQEYWSGLLWPLSGDLPNSGIEPISPSSPALAGKLPLSYLISHNNLQSTVLCSVMQLCPPLCYPMDRSPPGSSVHGDSSGKNVGMGCHALLQGIFPTQGSNTGLLHCRKILYHLSH